MTLRSNSGLFVLFSLSVAFFGCQKPDEGAGKIGEIKAWGRLIKAPIQSSPAVGPDGRIYIGAADRSLHALNAQGNLLWRYTSEGSPLSPAVSNDGEIVVFATTKGELLALDRDGRRLWSRTPRKSLAGCPPVLSKGGIVFTSGDLLLVSYVLKDGAPYALGKKLPPVLGCPVIDKDDRLFFSDGKQLHVWDLAKKAPLWTHDVGENFAGPAFGKEGQLYLTTKQGQILALSPQGQRLWTTQTQPLLPASLPAIAPANYPHATDETGRPLPLPLLWPTVAPNGDILAVRFHVGLYAFSKEGKQRWFLAQEDKPFQGRLTVTSEGMIFVGSQNHAVYAITPEGKIHYRFRTQGSAGVGGVLSPDGKLFYIGSFDSALYALHAQKQAALAKSN